MIHKLIIDDDEFVKTLKDASLYLGKSNPVDATEYLLLELKQKNLSIIACDGHGYYERKLNLVAEKGVKPSLPGKPMHLFINHKDVTAIAKGSHGNGNLELEVIEQENNYAVTITFPDQATLAFTAPKHLEIPNYAGFNKIAEKGKKESINIGQVQFPVKELTRVARVFPIKAGSTIPMYIAKWKKGGLLTLLEYDDIKVIFALTVTEGAY